MNSVFSEEQLVLGLELKNGFLVMEHIWDMTFAPIFKLSLLLLMIVYGFNVWHSYFSQHLYLLVISKVLYIFHCIIIHIMILYIIIYILQLSNYILLVAEKIIDNI